MTKNIHHIEQELVEIQGQTKNLKAAIYSAYESYLQVLGELVKKHLIFACYHICTYTYPEAFLELTFSQREKFQRTLKEIGAQAQEQLIASVTTAHQLPIEQQESDEDDPELLEESPSASESNEQLSDSQIQLASESQDSELEIEEKEITNPEDLVKWIKNQEKAIIEILKASSNKANRLLQKARILPRNLPTKVLEAAGQIEGSNSAVNSQPNLLTLLIEAESDKSEKNATSATKITAIYLRLTEIEFTESSLSVERNKLRELVAKVKNLRKQYQKYQRDLAVAQAESAWRASWYDD